jgi:hypothetical protein
MKDLNYTKFVALNKRVLEAATAIFSNHRAEDIFPQNFCDVVCEMCVFIPEDSINATKN